MEDHKVLQKNKRVHKRELNDISEWLGVLVYSLKRFRVWMWKEISEYGSAKKHGREKSLKSQFPYNNKNMRKSLLLYKVLTDII